MKRISYQWISSRIRIYTNLPYQLQRVARWAPLRNFLYSILVQFKPRSTGLELPDDCAEILKSLNDDGFSDLGIYLDRAQVSAIRSKLDEIKCIDRFRPHLGEFFVDNAPKETHVADFKVDELLRIHEIMNIANDPRVLAVAEAFLGCKPTLSNVQAWWSLTGHEKPEQAEFFHRDVDDWRFFKFFIYLTDVDAEAGPHVFIKRSQKIRTALPIRRYSDQEAYALFGQENVYVVTASAGAAFLENTFGFHKGQLPKSRRRLLLQFQYSFSAIGIISYDPVEVAGFSHDSYINRLYVK